MRTNNANSDKTAGFRSKPVTVELNGQTIDAAHHITSQNNRLLHLYIDERDGGIDVTVPLCSDKSAYARSDRGREALVIGTDSAGDDELLTADDIGRDDRLWLPGWDRSVPVIGTKTHADDPGNETPIDAVAQRGVVDPGFTPLDEVDRCGECGDLTVTGKCSCTADEPEPELVTDGGRDVTSDDEDGEQMRIDDFGGRRLVTDGGIDVRDGAIVRTCKHEACDEPAEMGGAYGRYCGQKCLNAAVATDAALSRCGRKGCMHATRGVYCSTSCARDAQLAREGLAGGDE